MLCQQEKLSKNIRTNCSKPWRVSPFILRISRRKSPPAGIAVLPLYIKGLIPCQDCSWSYIGETGRFLKTRKSEHVRNVKQGKKGSNVAKHAWTQDHLIDFANAKVIDKGNHRNLKTLESWHTALTDEADNNSNTLPAQYTILLRKELKKH